MHTPWERSGSRDTKTNVSGAGAGDTGAHLNIDFVCCSGACRGIFITRRIPREFQWKNVSRNWITEGGGTIMEISGVHFVLFCVCRGLRRHPREGGMTRGVAAHNAARRRMSRHQLSRNVTAWHVTTRLAVPPFQFVGRITEVVWYLALSLSVTIQCDFHGLGWVLLRCTGLGSVGLGSIALYWVGFYCVILGWVLLRCTGLGSIGLAHCTVERGLVFNSFWSHLTGDLVRSSLPRDTPHHLRTINMQDLYFVTPLKLMSHSFAFRKNY